MKSILYVILAAAGSLALGFAFGQWQMPVPTEAAAVAPPLPVEAEFVSAQAFDPGIEVDFAGEAVPLHDREVYERFDRELHINTYWHSQTIVLLKRAHRWFPRIEAVLRQHGLPEDFKYVVPIESTFDNVVSHRGAAGFWQLMPETARELGLEVNDEVDERFHPIKATHAACKLLKRMYRRFGNYTNALAAYNRGPNGLSRAMKHQQEDSYYNLALNPETSRYIFRVVAAKEVLSKPDEYGFRVPRGQRYGRVPTRQVKVTESLPSLVDFAAAQGTTYKAVRELNPWLRDSTLTVGPEQSYVLELPALSVPVATVADTLTTDSLAVVVAAPDSLAADVVLTPDTLQPAAAPDTVALPAAYPEAEVAMR